MNDHSPPPAAYSYVRFSSRKQEEGDSLRRQTEGATAWCRRNGVALDTTRSFRDLGRSAYMGKHRENPDRHALAAFLKLVEDGQVPRGSFLIVENLDRLSREHIQPALLLVLNLLQAGIRIVQLKPAEMVYDDKSDTLPVMMMMVELSRANSESRVKGDRVSAAWSTRKKRAREEGAIVTRRLPAWGEERDGKLVPDPRRARVVRWMFTAAVRGHGLALIVKKLTARRIKPWGRGAAWSKAYVHKILTGRAVLGEYQPVKGGQPDGDPLPNYYPAVIDESLWYQAQAALARRKDKAGRPGHKVASLFTGLLWDARTHDKMLIAWQTRGSGKSRQRARVLVPAGSMEGRSAGVSFSHPIFEEAILLRLKEINPADLTGGEPAGGAVALAGELAGVEARMSQLEGELTGDGDDVPALVRSIKTLDARRQDLRRRLAAARQLESNPRGEAWAEARTLLQAARDEAGRLRLRELLRTVVESVWILIVPRRSHRLAAVQINFAGGVRRDYLIHTWAAGYCREGGWEARSFADVAAPGDLDLRRPAHVKALEKLLAEMELD